MSAGQSNRSSRKRKPILYQPPLPPNEALPAPAVAGVTPVGLRPPFVTPATAHSHPDCRGILILIVAPHNAVTVRAAPLRSAVFSFENAISIGLRSGE